jgi:hypothetical protein
MAPSKDRAGPVAEPIRKLASVVRGQRRSDLHQLVIRSAIALAIMAIIAAGLGWIVAGCVPRSLRTITTTTREISSRNLHRQLGLEAERRQVTVSSQSNPLRHNDSPR